MIFMNAKENSAERETDECTLVYDDSRSQVEDTNMNTSS